MPVSQAQYPEGATRGVEFSPNSLDIVNLPFVYLDKYNIDCTLPRA